MTQQLHDLLHDLGDEQETVRIDPATYARGRRSHRRGATVRLGIAAAAVAAMAVGLTSLPEAKEAVPAITPPGGAALPSRLYDVPERLVSFTENGYVWDESVRARSLAIGPTSVVFAVRSKAVVAVSATDGTYRGLDLPGFDGDAFFRFMDAVVSLSPDGRRLAYTWNTSVTGNTSLGRPPQTGIRVADLMTGEVESFLMPSEFGVFAHGLAWSPNGHYLTYNLWTSSATGGRVQGPRNFTVERLDLRTGDRAKVDLSSNQSAPAVSNQGEVAVIDDEGARTWLEGRSPETRLAHRAHIALSVTWSPDGRLATGASDSNRPYVVRTGFPGQMTSRPLPDDIDRQTSTRVVGWLDDEVAVLRWTSGGHELTAIGPAGESRTLVTGVRMEGFSHVTFATGLLSEPTVDFPEPDWPFDWSHPRIWIGAIGLLALLWLGGTLLGHRRLHRSS